MKMEMVRRVATNTSTHPKCAVLSLHDLVQISLPQRNFYLLSQEEWWFLHPSFTQQVLGHSLSTGLITGVKTECVCVCMSHQTELWGMKDRCLYSPLNLPQCQSQWQMFREYLDTMDGLQT